MVGGESDSIGSICCKIESTMHDFLSPIFRKTQSTSCHRRRRDFFKISYLFYLMKMFEQTVESELEDSSGEHETATERYSRARRADVVR